MLDIIRDWIISITVATIIISVASTLAPKNTAGSFVRLAGALILVLTILAPIKKINISDIIPYQERYRMEFDEQSKKLSNENEKIQSLIIEDKMSTYICQRATQIGIQCSASVESHVEEDGHIYPFKVVITLPKGSSLHKRSELAALIENECSIPKTHQMYRQEG